MSRSTLKAAAGADSCFRHRQAWPILYGSGIGIAVLSIPMVMLTQGYLPLTSIRLWIMFALSLAIWGLACLGFARLQRRQAETRGTLKIVQSSAH